MKPEELLSQHAAPRKAEKMRTRNADSVQEVRERVRPIGDGEWFVGVGRCSGARCVPRHNLEVIRQTRQLSAPASGVAEEPVQQHQRRALACRPVGNRAYADFCVEQPVAAQGAASTFRFSPFRTALNVFRI